MKIFMSWSGEKSRTFAEVLKPWFEQVLPGNDVWLSTEDIDKGTIWFTEIIGELQNCHAGVICITRENHLSPWIHFEAGGLIKGLGKGRVGTVLLDIDYGELQQPLNQFNGTKINRLGAWQLVKALNKLSERPIKDRVLERTFEKFWPDLDEEYRMLFPDSHASAKKTEQPVHIVAEPTSTLLGPEKHGKTRKRVAAAEHETQAGLFNGLDEHS